MNPRTFSQILRPPLLRLNLRPMTNQIIKNHIDTRPMNMHLSRAQSITTANSIRNDTNSHRRHRSIITVSTRTKRPRALHTPMRQSTNLSTRQLKSNPLVILARRGSKHIISHYPRGNLISVTLAKHTITRRKSSATTKETIRTDITLCPRNMARNIRHLIPSSSH